MVVAEQKITIRLSIPAEQYVQHYRGVQQVSAHSLDGRLVLLPAKALRPFVTREGIHGTFCFHLGSSGKLLEVTRVH